MGDRRADGAHLQAISPANLAAQVQAPVLLIHGRDDTVVPIIQSRLMRDRLQAAGKQVRYVELDGDDHWLSEAATRTQMLRELDAFLSENLRAPLVSVDDSAAPSVH
jgi:dipeptidyl aminopeptidase/acylaminoacyl peptidase